MASSEERIISTLMEAVKQNSKTEAYDTPATVKRIDGETAWVHIPGGVDETPVKLTISASVGDTVQVRVSGGRAFLVGNATAPPTDDKVANKAVAEASEAAESAEAAVKTAEAAAKIAGDTNQYFWHTEEGTDTGAHITEIPREDFLADPENGGGNLLARSNGIALREGLVELATFQQSGLEIKSYNLGGNEVEVAHIGFGSVQGSSGTVEAPYYTFGERSGSRPVGELSFAHGDGVEASGIYSHAEGLNTHATAMCSHAEGRSTTASSEAAHAEGYGAMATNMYAHAEGYNSVASGGDAHAEGFGTVASGSDSHAQNNGTIAAGKAQTALGEFNVADTPSSSIQRGQYAVIVGNGTADNARSNALTVDWDGNVEAAGDVTDGAGNMLSDKVDIDQYKYTSVSLTHNGSSGTLKLRRHGPIVVGVLSITCSASTANSNLSVSGTVPSGYRPVTDTVYFPVTPVTSNSPSGSSRWSVSSAGAVNFVSSTTGAREYRSAVTWLTTDTMPS